MENTSTPTNLIESLKKDIEGSDVQILYITKTLNILIFICSSVSSVCQKIFKDKWTFKLNAGTKGYYYFTSVNFESDNFTTIIRMCYTFNKFSEIYDYIEVPCSLSEHFSEQNKIHFYICGDFHVRRNLCEDEIRSIDFLKFVEKTVKINKTKLINIFVEVPYKMQKIVIRESYLQQFYISLKNSDFQNVKVHSTDLRSISYESNNLIPLDFFKALRSFSTPIIIFGRALMKMTEVLEEYQGTDTFDFIYKSHDINGILTKKINDVNEPLRTQIVEFFQKEHQKYTKKYVLSRLSQISEVIQRILSSMDREEYLIPIDSVDISQEDVKTIDNFINEIIKFEAYIPDLYALLKVYQRKNLNKSSNVLIFCGEAHCRLIRKFLHQQGVILINQNLLDVVTDKELYDEAVKNGIRSCLDIRNFRQPFFYINHGDFVIEPTKEISLPRMTNVISTEWIGSQRKYLEDLNMHEKYIMATIEQTLDYIKYFLETFEIPPAMDRNIKEYFEYFERLYLGNFNERSEHSLKIGFIFYYMTLKGIFERSPRPKEDIVIWYHTVKPVFLYSEDYFRSNIVQIDLRDDQKSQLNLLRLVLNKGVIYFKDSIYLDDQLEFISENDTFSIKNHGIFNDVFIS